MKLPLIALASIFALFVSPATAQDDAVKLHPDSGDAAKEQLAKDVETLDKGILRVGEALNHAAAVLTREHNAIWSLPDDRLLAVLNADIQRTVAIASAKDKAAAEVNSLLNQLNIARFTNRAPIGLGRADVKYDEDAKLFVIVPPVEEPIVE